MTTCEYLLHCALEQRFEPPRDDPSALDVDVADLPPAPVAASSAPLDARTRGFDPLEEEEARRRHLRRRAAVVLTGGAMTCLAIGGSLAWVL